MQHHAKLLGLSILFIGLVAGPASALMMERPADVPADSFVSGAADRALDAYVSDGSDAPSLDNRPVSRTAEEGTSQELIDYVSAVPTGMAGLVLDDSAESEAVAPASDPVPEPAAGLLLVSGLGLLVGLRRRKRS